MQHFVSLNSFFNYRCSLCIQGLQVLHIHNSPFSSYSRMRERATLAALTKHFLSFSICCPSHKHLDINKSEPNLFSSNGKWTSVRSYTSVLSFSIAHCEAHVWLWKTRAGMGIEVRPSSTFKMIKFSCICSLFLLRWENITMWKGLY